MRTTLDIPMMMFGKFRSTVAARDEDGNAIVLRRDKKGKKVYKTVKSWKVHSEKNGDKGIYPSVNHMYTRMMGGRQKLIAPAERLKEKWEAAAYEWVDRNEWVMTEKEKVVIEMVAHFPQDKIKRDTNNVFKLMMDAFSEIIYDDDEYALPRVMDFKIVEEGEKPYFSLTIYKKEEEEEVMKQRVLEMVK